MNGRIKRADNSTRLVLPRIGKIKIGKKSEKGYPMSVDYFIPTGKYAGLFTQAYGEKPQTIQIVFPDDDAEKVCKEFYEYRDDKGALVAYGDGETFYVWNGKQYVEISTDKYPNVMKQVQEKYPNKQYLKSGDGWHIRLTLSFVVPLVRGIVGVWVFETNGNASTIPQVRDTFDMMLKERGFCKGILFDLSVKFATSQKPNTSSRYPVVSLIPNESEENVKKVQAKIMLEEKK